MVVPFFLEAAVGGCQVRACRRWKRARSAERRRIWHGGLGVEGGRGTFARWPIRPSRNEGWEGNPTKTAGPAGVSIAWGGKVPVGEGVGFLRERPRIYYKHQGRGSVVLWTRTNSSPRISPAGWALNSGAHPKTRLGGGLVLCLLCCFMGF